MAECKALTGLPVKGLKVLTCRHRPIFASQEKSLLIQVSSHSLLKSEALCHKTMDMDLVYHTVYSFSKAATVQSSPHQIPRLFPGAQTMSMDRTALPLQICNDMCI